MVLNDGYKRLCCFVDQFTKYWIEDVVAVCSLLLPDILAYFASRDGVSMLLAIGIRQNLGEFFGCFVAFRVPDPVESPFSNLKTPCVTRNNIA